MTAGHLIDTNVAIHLRDRHLPTLSRIATLDRPPLLSVLTRIELEAGVATRPAEAARIDEGNRELFDRLPTLALDVDEAGAHAAIVRAAGYSRRRTINP